MTVLNPRNNLSSRLFIKLPTEKVAEPTFAQAQ